MKFSVKKRQTSIRDFMLPVLTHTECPSEAERLYYDNPLYWSSVRGTIFEDCVGALLLDLTGVGVTKATITRRKNGTMRGDTTLENDFDHMGKKIEVKSSILQLRVRAGVKEWTVRLTKVKPRFFDHLWGVIFAPDEIYFFRVHNIRGSSVSWSSTRRGWRKALREILGRQGKVYRASDSPRVRQVLETYRVTPGEMVYANSHLRGPKRGYILEAFVRQLDKRATRNPPLTLNSRGHRRSAWQAEADYVCLDGTRVEVKSARAGWRPDICRWEVAFGRIKPQNHDELRLVFELPNNRCALFVFDPARHTCQRDGGRGMRVHIVGARGVRPSRESVMSLYAKVVCKLGPPLFQFTIGDCIYLTEKSE